MPLVGFASEFKRAGSSLRIEETDLSITNRAVSDMFDPHFVGSQNAKQIDRLVEQADCQLEVWPLIGLSRRGKYECRTPVSEKIGSRTGQAV
jgi:hypothetical protein